MCFSSASASVALSARSAKAISGSIIQNIRQVPARVRILRPERRPERVDPGQRQAVRLDVQLPRHREERLAPEEILRVVDLPRRPARQVREIQASRRGTARRPLPRPTS